MKETVNWSAIARIVGDDVTKFDELDNTAKMYVIEEKVGDRNLSEINNTSQENIKNLPDFKIPENVKKSADDLGVGRSVSNNSSHSYPQTSNNGEASQNCELLQQSIQEQQIQDLLQENDILMQDLIQDSYKLMQYLREPDLPDRPEILTFLIPLTDGLLGVRLGRSTLTANGSRDLGIFIMTVIPGGAASKDGRLKVNDRLVGIGATSLRHMSNHSARQMLRAAMTQPSIFLTVERIKGVGEQKVKAKRAQGPVMQRKQRVPGRIRDDDDSVVVSTTSPNQDEASESSFGRSSVYLTLISLYLVFVFLYVIYTLKDVFTHTGLCL